MKINDKILLIHNGALGDFLMAWPALWSLKQNLPERTFYWAGKKDYELWTRPLGILSCPPAQKMALLQLYREADRPADLAGFHIIRFGLIRPDLTDFGPDFWFLPGVVPGRFISLTHVFAKALMEKGVGFDDQWPSKFRRLFCGGMSPGKGKTALIFSGSGHRAKRWPLVQFLELAAWLQKQGLCPVFVLGPVERERGTLVQGFDVLRPDDLPALQEALGRARLVVGNDCGPMHLAGMLGLPGLVLFGPTSVRQWGPVGLRTLSRDIPCRPCTQTTADLDCDNPVCLLELEQQAVRAALAQVIEESAA
ncbi:MAG: glycosyltransferase family 9 protein [Thermodesulfobacteriota bacterium]|nr:glycosyltransferase family 9 protein [Thermodesulfobacteriota bacterium]